MLNVNDTIAANQLAASDPDANVWVNASAGSGKTKVLIDRILRLLLKGAKPKTIVCITFTQAAVLEMQHRLRHYLAQWIMMSDETLTQQLRQLDSSMNITSALILQARGLFNQILDESVQIQTIHSFAQKILSICHVESQIPFGARLMDEVNTKSLIHEAIIQLVATEQQGGGLKCIYKLFSPAKFNDIIQKIKSEQAFFRFVLLDGVDAFKKKLENHLSHPRPETEILDEINHSLSELNFTRLSDAFQASDNDRNFISQVLKSIHLKDIGALNDLFLTDKGTVRKRLVSKKISEIYPKETISLHNLAHHLFDWDQELKKGRAIESTLIIVKVAKIFLQTYAQLKHTKGVLDYDDLVFKTIEVLADPATAQNILYKLDNAIDHILIDEAQDTNLYQWKLIDFIVDSFFQSDQQKTMFVVGDHKQSIFGFQGTDPDIFHRIKSYYYSKASLKEWREVSLDVSFRSLQNILSFVDSVFENKSLINAYSNHQAFRGKGGKVVIHPVYMVNEEDIEKAYAQYATEIVDQIQKLIGTQFDYKGKMQTLHPKDFLVLIRKRGEHLDQLQKVLLERGIPFSAPTKKLLYEDSFVRFIIQTITLITQPFDDATIIQWLLNPLLNLAEEGVRVASQRAQTGGGVIDLLNHHPFLTSLKQAVEGYTSIEDLYLKINVWALQNLHVDSHQVSNAMHLLDFLKEWEWDQDPKIAWSEFVHHIQSLPIPQTVRSGQDVLRILTIHGAKGLQAPIVMLIDTTQMPITRNVFVRDDDANVFLCVPKRSDETIEYQMLKSQHKENELKEYYRLLYVALTRAENALHIFGNVKTKLSDDAWYTLCSATEV